MPVLSSVLASKWVWIGLLEPLYNYSFLHTVATGLIKIIFLIDNTLVNDAGFWKVHFELTRSAAILSLMPDLPHITLTTSFLSNNALKKRSQKLSTLLRPPPLTPLIINIREPKPRLISLRPLKIIH